MPAHIDDPAPDATVDPLCFLVRGWVWLEDAHENIAAIEAWSGNLLLGETTAMYSRPDVTTALGIPSHVLTGFTLPSLALSREREIELQISARLRDGTRCRSLCSREVQVRAVSTNPLGILRAALPHDALGLEIGAHSQPVPGLSPFYTDTVTMFAGAEGQVDFLADGCALPIPDCTLDYLCSSHVLEHLPNPVAALHEWSRVLRPGAWLYLVVPDMRFTFDHTRKTTDVTHLLTDFLQDSTAADSTEHITEFVYGTDWERLQPQCRAEDKQQRQAEIYQRYLADLRDGHTIDIHFHTFTPRSLGRLFTAIAFTGGLDPEFDLVASAERFPEERGDGAGFLLRKRHGVNSKRIGTTTLRHRDASIPPLPLVCSVTLDALQRVRRGHGSALVAEHSGLTYSMDRDLPVLLPPPTRRPLRPWSSGTRRWMRHLAAHVRLLECSAWRRTY